MVYTQKAIWNITIFLPIFVIFLISSLAETNRIPFDLPEAEAEIVAGYNIEYSGLIFALFFLAEYSNMLLNTAIISLVFLDPAINTFNVCYGFNSFFRWLVTYI